MLRPLQPIVYYELNQDYIAEFLCINKDKPEMHCNGKCYLKKEIKKQQKEGPDSQKIIMENYPIGFVEITILKSQSPIFQTISSPVCYSNLYRFEYNISCFHPPDLV